MALKPYTVEFKAQSSPTVGLNAGQLPYSLLKKMRATVKLEVFAQYFAIAPRCKLKCVLTAQSEP